MQFCVYQNINAASQAAFPFVLYVQSNLLDELRSVVVIPLSRHKKSSLLITRLMPVFLIDGKEYVLNTTQITTMHRNILGHFVVDLNERRDEIVSAMDFLLSGV